jgi:cytochrome bd ubiquinol oxidase subunit II
MELQIIWFVLWSILWAVYFMLDGFVLGSGMLQNFVARSDIERRVVINTLGPVWDGNEVWLITAGGVTFAAFPTTYALMFSYLYTPLLLLLFSLIVRGVAFEFRGKVDDPRWKSLWDRALLVSSFLPALLFGVTFGNLFRGLPMDAAGYHGSLMSLMNPYGLVTGILFVLLFVVHGGLYLSVKTTGAVKARSVSAASAAWIPLLVVAGAFLIYTYPATHLFDNFLAHPGLLVVPLLAVLSLLGIKVFLVKGKLLPAFTASSLTILLVVATGVVGLFPNLIPSSLDTRYSLTAFNSSSSPYTLKIMTGVAILFLPIIIAYKVWVYRVFRAPVTNQDVLDNKQAY